MSRKRRLITAAIFVAVATVTVGAVLFVRACVRVLDLSLEAEERLHATILVSDVVGDFIEMNGFARWPSSWKDLEDVPPRHWSTYRWPDDRSRLRELVNIDFGADLAHVATGEAESFTAVQPAGECYEVWRFHAAEPLLKRLQAGVRDSPAPPR